MADQDLADLKSDLTAEHEKWEDDVDRIGDALNALGRLKKRKLPDDRKPAGKSEVDTEAFDAKAVDQRLTELASSVQRLTAAIGDFQQGHARLLSSTTESAPQLAKSTDSPAKSSALPPTPSEDAVQSAFSDFIKSVGHSVAEAQRDLDQESRRYVDTVGRPGGALLPTAFRIPKLSAEIRFAFHREGTEKLNLLFYSGTDKQSREHQQSVSFDIVSAPVPPDVMSALERETPSLTFVLAPGARTRVFEAVNAYRLELEKDGQGASADELKALELDKLLGDPAPDPETQDQVLIFPADIDAVPTASPTKFLLLCANPKKGAPNHKVGIWHLQLETDKKRLSVEAVVQFSRKGANDDSGTENQGPLRLFVAHLALKQAELLKNLRTRA